MTKVFVIDSKSLTSLESDCLSIDTHQPSLSKNIKDENVETDGIIYVNNSQEILSSAIISISSHKDEETTIDKNNEKVANEKLHTADTKANTTPSFEISNEDNKNKNKKKANLSLYQEKEFHQDKARKREERLRDIILNKRMEFEWVECLAYFFGIVVIGFSSTLALSLIPAHDLVQFPKFWYEAIFHATFPTAFSTLYQCVFSALILNLNYLVRKETILFVGLINIGTQLFLILLLYFIWTQIFGYQFPIPFLGFNISLIFLFLQPLVIWVRLPLEWRQKKNFKKKVMVSFSLNFLVIIIILLYQMILIKIQMAEDHNQPFVALALPVMREVSIWLGIKLVEHCSNGDEKGAKIFLQYAFSTRHAITLCYVIGSFATETTSWILMAVDFSLNILICLKIVWTRKQHPYKIKNQIDSLQDLVVYELVEFHAPLAFILVIFVSYHGPNAEIFGNVGNSYWQFSAIEDIHRTLTSMAKFFLVDFSSTLVSASILWVTCKINLWKAFLETQKEFGKFFALVLGSDLVVV